MAVFASHQCARVPGALGACDHLEEQLFPTDAWGRRFVLTPLATRGRRGVREPTEVNYWRIVADTDATVIALSRPYAELEPTGPAYVGGADCAAFLTGPAELTLGAGQWCEVGTLHPFGLEASVPVMVAGLLSGRSFLNIEEIVAKLDSTAQQGDAGHRWTSLLALSNSVILCLVQNVACETLARLTRPLQLDETCLILSFAHDTEGASVAVGVIVNLAAQPVSVGLAFPVERHVQSVM